MNSMKQIVCLSTTNWYPQPTRKQQVMSRLSGAEILYFDPPVTYLAPYRDPKAKERVEAYKSPGQKARDNITVYAMPPVLPFYNKYRSINQINQKKLGGYVSRRIAEAGFTDPVLWVYSPMYADILSHLSYSHLVYDCVDRHSAYKGFISPAVVDGMEFELAKRADMVFTTARGLYDRLKPCNDSTELIPNGANYELFSRAAVKSEPRPADLSPINGRIFGFIGALQECIEYSFVEAAAAAHPEWSFVFIGSRLPGVSLESLESMPNVHFLGQKPHEALTGYLQHMDVCLNIFTPGDLAKDVSPLKFYEYLATGKPIVSTPQPDQVLEFKDAVYIAPDPDAFIACCEKAAEESDKSKTELRMRYGRESSWETRVGQMVQHLKTKEIF